MGSQGYVVPEWLKPHIESGAVLVQGGTLDEKCAEVERYFNDHGREINLDVNMPLTLIVTNVEGQVEALSRLHKQGII